MANLNGLVLLGTNPFVLLTITDAERVQRTLRNYEGAYSELAKVLVSKDAELARVQVELDVARAELADVQEHNTNLINQADNLASTIRKMHEEVGSAKATKDTELLDWMDAQASKDKKACGCGEGDQIAVRITLDYGETFREAIRVVMADPYRRA